MKILLSAYACEPAKGSEPGVGWNWALQIAKLHEVWVITRSNNRSSIENYLNNNPHNNLNFIFVDLPPYLVFWKKGQRGIRLYYYLWQIWAYFLAKRYNNNVRFDIVHHITLGTYWLPSFMYNLPIPFVFGPVGGGDKIPSRFLDDINIRGRSFEYIRNLRLNISKFDPFLNKALKKAKYVLVNTSDTQQAVKQIVKCNTWIFSHMGIDPEEFKNSSLRKNVKSTKIRFVSVGRQIHWKGFHLGIQAFSSIEKKNPHCEYWLIGDGVEHNRLNELVTKLDLNDKVIFIKKVSRDIVIQYLFESDIMIHPALHDSAPSSVLEGMAASLPVIYLDLAGPTIQLTSETGFKIPAKDPEQAINDIAEAMLRLVNDPELRRKMGEKGRERVKEHFSWEKKGEFINEIYRQVLAEHENTARS